MDLFVTAESTVGVAFDDLRALTEIEEAFNQIAARTLITEVATLAIVFIIMDARVATPFPEGAILRRSRSMLDLKIQIDFTAWSASSRAGKRALAVETAIAFLERVNSRKLTTPAKDQIVALLARIGQAGRDMEGRLAT